MTKRAYPLRIPSGLLELADLKSAEERTERSIALRQWLYLGAEDLAAVYAQVARSIPCARDWP